MVAKYFVIGAALSILTLAWFGNFGREEVVAGIVYIPAPMAGFWISSFMVRHLHGDRVRQILLGLCAIALVVLVMKPWIA